MNNVVKRVFIIGNGPSLNKVDMTRLACETTISFNRAYIAYQDWGFYPTYYMCIDPIVLNNIKDDINRLIARSPIREFFLPDWTKSWACPSDKVRFMNLRGDTFFGTSLGDLSMLGNVGACSTQILRYLGFDEAILLGVDCRYQESNLENVKIEHNPNDKERRIVYKSHGNSDPNHFRPDYFGKGCEYGKPQQQNHLNHWKFLGENGGKNGLRIVSASPGSNVNDIFPYVEFSTLFAKKNNETRKPSSSCLFVPSSDTHVHWMAPIAERLQNSEFLLLPYRKEGAEERLKDLGAKYRLYRPGVLAQRKPSVLVLGNDWSWEELLILDEAKRLGIPTVCIQEGCVNLYDTKEPKMVNADYAFLQGPVMTEFLKRTENYIAVGNPKYDSIFEAKLPSRAAVMINSNFTYNVYEEARERWVRDAVEACEALGLPFFISQHPRDSGVFPPHWKVVKSDAYKVKEQLEASSILISRFSTVIYEAMMMGREVVYYNPHQEAFGLFAEDRTCGIVKENTPERLTESLQLALWNLGRNGPCRRAFLLENCTTLSRNAGEKCAAYLEQIAEKHCSAQVIYDSPWDPARFSKAFLSAGNRAIEEKDWGSAGVYFQKAYEWFPEESMKQQIKEVLRDLEFIAAEEKERIPS